MASLVSSSATHHGASLCWSMSLCSSRRRRHDGSSSTNNYNNVVAASRRHRSSSVSSSSGGRKKGRRCHQTSFFSSSSRQNREKKSAWCLCRVGRDAGVQKVVVQAAASKSSGTSATHWGGGSSASVEDVKKCALITAIKTPYLKSGKIDLQKYGTRARRIVASSHRRLSFLFPHFIRIRF